MLFQKLNEHKVQMFIYEPFYTFLKKKIHINGSVTTFNTHADLVVSKIDYMLSLGGDGTFLSTLHLIRNSGIPVLGINTGTLGFLANVAQSEISNAIEALALKKYTIEKRALISVSQPHDLFGEVNYGLNELTISKKSDLAMINIHTYINGNYLNTYHSDGLIIATPTGSTAYSLSCGGPIVMPGSQNFLITPIAPHNLTVRPLVISDSNTITLKVDGRSDKYLASLDSTIKTIDSSVEITIKKADFYLHIIKLENQTFFNTIRNKLLWGLDSRS
jgi:NAD+ kinase